MALTLGRFVAGSSARAKARRVGIIDETQEAEERRVLAAELKPQWQIVLPLSLQPEPPLPERQCPFARNDLHVPGVLMLPYTMARRISDG
jgi:hypothetical protein